MHFCRCDELAAEIARNALEPPAEDAKGTKRRLRL
jgi:hypothetical protein